MGVRAGRKLVHLTLHHFEQLVQAAVCDGTDGINFLAGQSAEFLHGFIRAVGHEVGLGRDDDFGSFGKFFAVRGKFRAYLHIVVVRVPSLAARNVHDVHDEADPLDMPQKIMSEPRAVARAFN